MTTVLIIFAISCIALITLIFAKPGITIKNKQISIYWVAPLVGAIAVTAFGFISPSEIWAGLANDSDVNPFKILILFFSMTFLSIYLDEAGFFKAAASTVLKKAKSSQKTLFVLLYITVSILTIFTSNDIIVLTFTPFICYFCKNAKINPLPYLFCEFIAANTWSMVLIIGNPTNIYLASSAGASFLEYTSIMLLPTVFAGLASFLVLVLLFRKSLSAPISKQISSGYNMNKPQAILGGLHLAVCTVMLAIASYINLPMWIISFVAAISLCISDAILTIVSKNSLGMIKKSASRIPFELFPFTISMFILVLALDKTGALGMAAEFLSKGNSMFKFEFFSVLSSNIVNNIPMSVMFSSITSALADSASYTGSLYASIIGSNIGAFLTPIGALAGIMWIGLLKKQNVEMSFTKFTKYGSAIAIPTMTAAFFGLNLAL